MHDACSGVRVLELADGFCTAALCGQVLAGLRAHVVKWERFEGDPLRTAQPLTPDGTSHAFHLLNSNKRSVRSPVDPAEALAKWLELVECSDVILIDRNSVGPAGVHVDPIELSKQFPTKVVCISSVFGVGGSRANWVGGEFIAESLSGLLICSGYPEQPPVQCGVPYAIHVSSLFAFQGILAALREREHSSRGQLVELSVVDCLVCLLGNFIPSYFLSGKSPKRVGNRHTIAAPWNLYPTMDGHVVICTGTGGSGWWKKITAIIQRPELATDSRYDEESKRVAHVDQVDEIVSEWTRVRSSKDVVALMEREGIPVSEITSVENLIADPHYSKKRGIVGGAACRTKDPAFTIPLVGLPFTIAGATPREPAPALGDQFREDADSSPHIVANHASTPAVRDCLSGMRVLEFGSRTSVPMAGRLLADMGADVIKIEPPKGESLRNAGQPIGGSSYTFHINNAGKRSVVIDPDDPAGRELILAMVKHADVWLENLAPGVLERMGLGYEAMRAVNPRIVYCSVSGFGLKSDYGEKKAFDSVIQAASGIMNLTGYPDHLPVKIGISASDLAAGVTLVGAVLGALRLRAHTSVGTHIDLAMADIGAWMTQSVWPDVFYGSGHPRRQGNRSAGKCPQNLFATQDGLLAISVERDDQWFRFSQLIGDAGLIGDTELSTAEGRLKQISRVERAVTVWARERLADEAARKCQAIGVPAAPVRSLADVVNDKETTNRHLIVDVEHPLAGAMKILGNPLNLSRTPVGVVKCAPLLGEHTWPILADWLSLPDSRLKQLKEAGIIVCVAEGSAVEANAAS